MRSQTHTLLGLAATAETSVFVVAQATFFICLESLHPVPNPNAAQYEKRDALIVRHLALYRLTLPAIIRQVFFGGKEPGHVLKRLCDLGQLLAHLRSLPGGLTYYTLTPLGCGLANVSESRAEPFQGATFELSLGALSYCFQGRARRHLLTTAEAEAHLGAPQAPQVPWVVSEELGEPCLLRLVEVGGVTPHKLVGKLDNLAAKLAQAPELHRRLLGRELGFGVLVPTPDKCPAYERALESSRLSRELVTVVDVGATTQTLSSILKSQREDV